MDNEKSLDQSRALLEITKEGHQLNLNALYAFMASKKEMLSGLPVEALEHYESSLAGHQQACRDSLQAIFDREREYREALKPNS